MNSREIKMKKFIKTSIEKSLIPANSTVGIEDMALGFDESVVNAAYTMIEECIEKTTSSSSDISHKIKTLIDIRDIIDGCTPFLDNHDVYDNHKDCDNFKQFKSDMGNLMKVYNSYTKNVSEGLRNFSDSIKDQKKGK